MDFLRSYIRSKNSNCGTVTLFIRPQKNIRAKLYQASQDEFDDIRNSITLEDYEFYFTCRAQADFTDRSVYEQIVGNFINHTVSDPEKDDAGILGAPTDILKIWQHISVAFIDALRDASTELHKSNNPIRRIFDAVQDQISASDIDLIKNKVKELNTTLANLREISDLGNSLNQKLHEIVGLVYSPDIKIESRLQEDINSLARYLTAKPSGEESIELLGLGHLNILYIALKLVEFDVSREHQVLNLMVVEEPEAHLHVHIQKTLFHNLQVSREYTQVIMTTHSTHISETSNIKSMNVLKVENQDTVVMQPTKGLDDFGINKLALPPKRPLTACLSRYLDAKRSILLFSKGVILVEGDAEEILIPNLVKKAYGISLDELGVGLINIGGVAFENVASVFDEERIHRYCAIVTDSDAPVPGDTSHSWAFELGKKRQQKLTNLYAQNSWVSAFYAPHTFEYDFFSLPRNDVYFRNIVELSYSSQGSRARLLEEFQQNDVTKYQAIMEVAEKVKKGWLATLTSEIIDGEVMVPDYIADAIAFASQEVIKPTLIMKMLMSFFDRTDIKNAGNANSSRMDELGNKLKTISSEDAMNTFIEEFITDPMCQNSAIAKFIIAVRKYHGK